MDKDVPKEFCRVLRKAVHVTSASRCDCRPATVTIGSLAWVSDCAAIFTDQRDEKPVQTV